MTDGRLSLWSFPLPLVGACVVAVAPLGYRAGVLPLGIAFLGLVTGVLLSFVVLVVAVTTLVRGRCAPGNLQPVLGAAAISTMTGLGPLFVVLSALGLPAIHDITTDLDDPPRFEAIVSLRADAPNSIEYGGQSVAAAQRQAYPDLVTLVLSQPSDRVLEWAREVVQEIGWEIVAVDVEAGRVEATDTTLWFGFKDDIVVRVRQADGGAQVDVRSVSRVGGGDLGANAARVRVFLEELEMRAAVKTGAGLEPCSAGRFLGAGTLEDVWPPAMTPCHERVHPVRLFRVRAKRPAELRVNGRSPMTGVSVRGSLPNSRSAVPGSKARQGSRVGICA